MNIRILESILKYIDISYMTEDECDNICEVDINDEEGQKKVIATLIVPGVRTEFSEKSFERMRKVIEIALQNTRETEKVFSNMSFPFEDEIFDKKSFLEKIYNSLF